MGFNTEFKSWRIDSIDRFKDTRGTLSVAEFGSHYDFRVERIFYLSDIDNDDIRGQHAHEELKQFVICVSGSFDISLDNGKIKETLTMSDDGKGLFLDGLVWREMTNFTENTVMLVLCDRVYKNDRVIRNYSEFLTEVKERYNEV
jgi:dTDP-4-dehydrorhamnose 3,5-epimerase-like enzyme